MRVLQLILSFTLLISQNILSQSGWYWQNPYPQPNELNDLFFIDANVGWAVGNYGTMLYSSDGGATWGQQYYGTDPLNAARLE